MDLFETLIDDHRLISRTLDAFEGFVAAAEKSESIDLVELNRFVVFFREFAELIHHDREEGILFSAMEKLGYARNGAPIAHVRNEHDRERQLLFVLRQAAVRTKQMTAAKTAHVIGVVREFIAFERSHMKKENELLYPAVKKEFSGRTLAEVSRALYDGPGADRRLVECAWLRALAEELIRDYPMGALPRARKDTRKSTQPARKAP